MKEKNTMLDFLTQPGFCAEDGIITQVNDAAAALLLTPGTGVDTLLLTGREELAHLGNGCLYLKLNLTPEGMDAFVTNLDGTLVFLLDPHPEKELQAFALASRELRGPLSGMMVSADRISMDPTDPRQEDWNRLNRSLHQTLRMLGNMSDACHLPNPDRQEMTNLTALFEEIFQKAQWAASSVGITLTYEGPQQEVFSLADREQLERAVLNILSNSMKFTPEGGQIHVKAVRRGRQLCLQVADTGCGIAPDVRSTLFCRYKRQPGIEDSRRGVGLGMVIIRSAAACHGGTVLVDQPKAGGTRVTLTLSLRKETNGTLRSPQIRPDYTGEWNHMLVELADILPAEVYRKGL